MRIRIQEGKECKSIRIRIHSPRFHSSNYNNFTVLAGACELPEAAEVLCAQRSEASAAQAAEEALPLPLLQGDQVLPVHQPGLGGGGAAGLPPGIQHAQPAHPQVRLGFFSS